jgi:hypothetical protein
MAIAVMSSGVKGSRKEGIIVVDNSNEIPERLRELKQQGKLRVK